MQKRSFTLPFPFKKEPEKEEPSFSEAFRKGLEISGFSFEKPLIGCLYQVEILNPHSYFLTGTVIGTEEFNCRVRLYVSSPRCFGMDIIYFERCVEEVEWRVVCWNPIKEDQEHPKIERPISLDLS